MKRPKLFLPLVGTVAIALLVIGTYLAVSQSKSGKGVVKVGHSVTLNWQASPGAKYYCVYRSPTSGSGYQKVGTSAATTFEDAPVAAGATFFYVVTSVRDGVESKYSGEITATVPKDK